LVVIAGEDEPESVFCLDEFGPLTSGYTQGGSEPSRPACS